MSLALDWFLTFQCLCGVESEEAKERILADGTVSVSGEKLSILRVDAPKTTVMRISNVDPLCKFAKILSICGSYGQVKRLVKREASIFDVHFSSSEWTNLVKILDRLNGLVMDKHQWIAQPSTVIPAEVLQALWSKPEGRVHVHEMIHTICKRIEANSIDTAPMRWPCTQILCRHLTPSLASPELLV